ncbi:unnamed protein product, partial [Scytosiphon promiscuus]
MEDGDNDDDLFDLEEDDEELKVGQDTADVSAVDHKPVASAEIMAGSAAGTRIAEVSSTPPGDVEVMEEEEDGGMGSDPYSQHDWDFPGGAMGEEAETRQDRTALLFDRDDSIDSDHGLGDADSDCNDDDLNSLMDRGLEEVDDLLNVKGRLSVFSPAHAPSEARAANAGDRKHSSVLSAHDIVGTGSGSGHQEGELLHPTTITARGAGGNAANVLTFTTAPSESPGATLGIASSQYPDTGAPALTQQQLGGSCSSATVSGHHDVVARDQNSNNREGPKGEDNLARHNGVQSYCYDSHVTTGPGGNAVNLSSPPRRRTKGSTPFLRAEGLTLTYAQAKLFGLHAAGSPPTATTLTNEGLQAANVVNRAHSAWPGPGPRRTKVSDINSTCAGGRTRDDRVRHHRGQVRTYSPVRMERLARPLPVRDRVGGRTTAGTFGNVHPSAGERRRGVGAESPTFTWKRSQKAEAAMRDPACGYDFVRESGYSKEEFLRRVEAYSSYSRQKLETRRGEAAYAARVDKLECPKCGIPQSYDEFVSKKLKCGGCDLAYRMPRTWNRRVWDQRNEMCAMKSQERKARIKKLAQEEFLRRLPRQTRYATLLRQRVGQVGFIRRMHRDLRRRRAREGEGIVDRDNRDDAQDGGDTQRRRPHRREQRNHLVNRPASAPPAT